MQLFKYLSPIYRYLQSCAFKSIFRHYYLPLGFAFGYIYLGVIKDYFIAHLSFSNHVQIFHKAIAVKATKFRTIQTK